MWGWRATYQVVEDGVLVAVGGAGLGHEELAGVLGLNKAVVAPVAVVETELFLFLVCLQADKCQPLESQTSSS